LGRLWSPPNRNRGHFPSGDKWRQGEVDHSPPSIAETLNVYRILIGKPLENVHLDARITLRWTLQRQSVKKGSRWNWFRIDFGSSGDEFC
jgi:hypothetical protein